MTVAVVLGIIIFIGIVIVPVIYQVHHDEKLAIEKTKDKTFYDMFKLQACNECNEPRKYCIYYNKCMRGMTKQERLKLEGEYDEKDTV